MGKYLFLFQVNIPAGGTIRRIVRAREAGAPELSGESSFQTSRRLLNLSRKLHFERESALPDRDYRVT